VPSQDRCYYNTTPQCIPGTEFSHVLAYREDGEEPHVPGTGTDALSLTGRNRMYLVLAQTLCHWRGGTACTWYWHRRSVIDGEELHVPGTGTDALSLTGRNRMYLVLAQTLCHFHCARTTVMAVKWRTINQTRHVQNAVTRNSYKNDGMKALKEVTKLERLPYIWAQCSDGSQK
jgi:hypothetical protein